MRPSSISIYLADGSPDGIRIVEKSNWTGQAVMANRTQLALALNRDEFDKPGVYVLIGPREGSARRIYVGEADVLRDRLRQHAVQKEFWTQFIAFTASDQNLNKAHVRYLESKLVRLAKKANQWVVENGNEPNEPSLAERERAHAEWFLHEMLVIYPILGVDAFEDAASEKSEVSTTDLELNSRGAVGKGREVNDGFVVLEGSIARVRENDSIPESVVELRRDLLQRGVMVQQDDAYSFTQDYRFGSPSTAAAVLIGGNANGRTAWKTAQGQTLKSIQQAREGTT